MKKIKYILLISFIFYQILSNGQTNGDWTDLDKRQTPNWYEDAKFGIFIHWGLYSVPSWATKSNADGFGSGYSEWYWQRLNEKSLKIHPEFTAFHHKNYGPNFKYQDFVQQFHAELFDPDHWADVFKKSGAKYVVLTSKHHEGFALWKSKYAWNWNAFDVGPHRDLAGDLIKSVKNKGLKMGFYYSLYEWYHPLYKNDISSYVQNYMVPQIKELVNQYEPDIFWPDGEWDKSDTTWHSTEIVRWLYNHPKIKDNIVINDRWGNNTKGKHGSFYTTEYGAGNIDNNSPKRPWEECRGIGQSFGYNRNEYLEDYSSAKELIHSLINIISNGGNLLLNIGPTADGRIPVIMEQRLMEIGNWLKVNGSAIYGTRKLKTEIKSIKKHNFFTENEHFVYLILTKWDEKIELEGTFNPKSINLLGSTESINFIKKGNKIIIDSPKFTPENIPCHSAWVFELKK